MTSQNSPQLSLAGVLIDTTPWATLRCATGDNAASVGLALRALLDADEPGLVPAIRNEIENYVVPQSSLQEAAEPTMRVLAAVFADNAARWVRVAALDLMYWIMRGSAGPGDLETAAAGLHQRCAERGRESLWLFVRQAADEPIFFDAVADVVSLIDTDGSAIAVLHSLAPDRDDSEPT